MEITKDLLMCLEDSAEHNNTSIDVSYSGRGMFGSTCLGISGSLTDIIKTIHEACIDYVKQKEIDNGESIDVLEEMKKSLALFNNFSQDSLGMGVILYYPYLKYSKDCIEYLDEEYND